MNSSFAPPEPVPDAELKRNLQFALIETVLHHNSAAGQDELFRMPVPSESQYSGYFPDGIQLVQSGSEHRIVFTSKDNRNQLLEDLALPNSSEKLESISEFKASNEQTNSTAWLQYPLQDVNLRFNVSSVAYVRKVQTRS